MRLNTLLLSSVLTLFVSINANPVPQVQRFPSGPNSIDDWNKKINLDQFMHAPQGEQQINYDCTEEEKNIDIQREKCVNANGLFYRNNPIGCNIEYVCFIPCIPGIKMVVSKTLIESKYYCSADYSSIPFCKYGTIDYNFKQCLEKASSLFYFSYTSSKPFEEYVDTGLPLPKILGMKEAERPIH